MLGQLGYDGDRSVEPVVHLVGHGACVGRPDAERVAQLLVHLGERGAEPGRLGGEVAADLVGMEIGLGEQVADAGERDLPAVTRGAEELLQHREMNRCSVLRRRLDPSVEVGDVRRARPRSAPGGW